MMSFLDHPYSVNIIKQHFHNLYSINSSLREWIVMIIWTLADQYQFEMIPAIGAPDIHSPVLSVVLVHGTKLWCVCLVLRRLQDYRFRIVASGIYQLERSRNKDHNKLMHLKLNRGKHRIDFTISAFKRPVRQKMNSLSFLLLYLMITPRVNHFLPSMKEYKNIWFLHGKDPMPIVLNIWIADPS